MRPIVTTGRFGRNKDTYTTSGTRIKRRMFGGYHYTADMRNDAGMVSKIYAAGVPIGGSE